MYLIMYTAQIYLTHPDPDEVTLTLDLYSVANYHSLISDDALPLPARRCAY